MALKIISTPIGKDGCSGYRVIKPLEGLRDYCGCDVHIIEQGNDNMVDLVKAMAQADIIYLRPGAESGRRQILAIPELRNAMKNTKWVLDIDDNLEIISPFSEFYRNNGMEEVYYNGKPLWIDGKDGFSLQRNKEKIYSQIVGLKDMDMVVTTTDLLADYARKYNANVYTNDNTIDFTEWWKVDHSDHKPLRVVWQGSPSHYGDWFTIKEPLEKLMDEYDFEILMVGSTYKGIFGNHYSRVKSLPWVNFDAHSYRMMSLTPDIAIIPLEDNVFNSHKSAIKYYEMSAMGIPSVVANVKPYSEVINENRAMVYGSPDEFYIQMKMLLDSQLLRKKIGDNAYKWVYDNKNLEKESHKLYEALEKLCQTKKL